MSPGGPPATLRGRARGGGCGCGSHPALPAWGQPASRRWGAGAKAQKSSRSAGSASAHPLWCREDIWLCPRHLPRIPADTPAGQRPGRPDRAVPSLLHVAARPGSAPKPFPGGGLCPAHIRTRTRCWLRSWRLCPARVGHACTSPGLPYTRRPPALPASSGFTSTHPPAGPDSV